MKQKDTTEKMLADYNDVFADIVNVLLFEGRQVIDERQLVNTKDRQQQRNFLCFAGFVFSYYLS